MGVTLNPGVPWVVIWIERKVTQTMGITAANVKNGIRLRHPRSRVNDDVWEGSGFKYLFDINQCYEK